MQPMTICGDTQEELCQWERMGTDQQSAYRKKKVSTQSSTEAELVGADNAMPHMLWTRFFLEIQVYGIDDNILYEDNMSTMLLENNGKKSSTKNTKHINMRYYFIKDRVETGDMVIEHLRKKKNAEGPFHKATTR